MTKVTEVKCWKCGYTWQPRVKAPKSCPECKTRLGQKARRRIAA
jgi:predicted Zn-ribbon and HTH transcriptional regulator